MNWPNYSVDVFRANADYDSVLVDGRFRIACVAQTICNCDLTVKILIHDFVLEKNTRK